MKELGNRRQTVKQMTKSDLLKLRTHLWNAKKCGEWNGACELQLKAIQEQLKYLTLL